MSRTQGAEKAGDCHSKILSAGNAKRTRFTMLWPPSAHIRAMPWNGARSESRTGRARELERPKFLSALHLSGSVVWKCCSFGFWTPPGDFGSHRFLTS